VSCRGRDGGPGTGRQEAGVPVALKVLLWVVAIAIAIVVLFTWVFPWVEAQQQDPTMGSVQLLRAPR
jgi:hypothetical protein